MTDFIKNLNKKKLPSPKSVRPVIFNIEMRLVLALALFFVILVVTTLVGFRLFHYIYFEQYKKEISPDNFRNLINMEMLNDAIEQRNKNINRGVTIPRDPS